MEIDKKAPKPKFEPNSNWKMNLWKDKENGIDYNENYMTCKSCKQNESCSQQHKTDMLNGLICIEEYLKENKGK